MKFHRLLSRIINPLAIIASLSVMMGARAFADAPFRVRRIQTADGLTIAVQEWGNPNGPAIVLIHGLLQSHLSWVKQTSGPLAKRFHLVTYDLRGHGESDAPTDAKYYKFDAPWAQELDAVIKATHITRPILVGWSMGGIVVSEYVKIYGSSQLGGLVYLDSWIAAPETKGRSNADMFTRMESSNPGERIAARTAFLHACYWHQPPASEFATQLAFNRITPPKALAAMVDRPLNYDAIAGKTRLPVLVYHGEHDQLMPIAAAKHTQATFPNATLIIAPGVGHAGFYEKPDQFEHALVAFADRILPR